MAPKISKGELKRRNRMDKLIYDNVRKRSPDVKKLNSKAMPYAEKQVGEKGYMALPKDPSKGNMTRSKKRTDLRGAEGTHNRSMLAHESSELKMERLKAKKGPAGKRARKDKAIKESDDVIHSSAHPLVAEANIARRNPKALKDMEEGWKESPAQGKMLKHLKNVGWTPARGLPEGGRQAAKLQRKAEKTFGPYYGKEVKRKISRAKKTLKGKKLKKELAEIRREAKEYAK